MIISMRIYFETQKIKGSSLILYENKGLKELFWETKEVEEKIDEGDPLIHKPGKSETTSKSQITY